MLILLGIAHLLSKRTHISFGSVPHLMGPHGHESPGHFSGFRGQQKTGGGAHSRGGDQGSHEYVAARHFISSSGVLIVTRLKRTNTLCTLHPSALPGYYQSRTIIHVT